MQSSENKAVSRKWTMRLIWRKFLHHTEAKLAFKSGLAASISLMLGVAFAKVYDRPDIFVSGLWCVMASIVVMQAHLGETYKAAWIRFLGVVVGSIAGGILINLIGSTALSLAVSVFCTIVVCSLLNLKDSFRIAGMSTAIIIIMGGVHPVINPWMFSFYRFIDSCIGILVAVFVAQVIWPEKAIQNIRINIAKTLNLLGKYYLLATNLDSAGQTYIQSSDAMSLEIEGLLEENRDYCKEAELEIFETQTRREHWMSISEQLDIIFSAVTALMNVPKATLSAIFDDGLDAHLAGVIDKTAAALQSLQNAMTSQGTIPSFEPLALALKDMNTDLQRFRATRTTRKFNLEDVESFYVFFYSLRSIGEAVIKISSDCIKL